jgi:hypothetical protein
VAFDTQQTDGAPLTRVEVPILEGEHDRTLYGCLEDAARSEGLPVEWVGDDELDEGTMGYYHPRERRIVSREASTLHRSTGSSPASSKSLASSLPGTALIFLGALAIVPPPGRHCPTRASAGMLIGPRAAGRPVR